VAADEHRQFDAAALGYRMPGEFEAHAATWMAWPCRHEIWGETFAAVKEDFARVARTIARFEPVMMVARPKDAKEARRACAAGVEVVEFAIDDSWARDSGPTFVVDGRGGLTATAWTFNAWGNKYQPYDQDALLARRIAARVAAPVAASSLVLEGGAIQSDGEGTLVTTESCLLNPNRNPGIGKSEVERELQRMLGARRIIWLPGDPSDTETDGHIDGLMAFVAPGKVVVGSCKDRSDPRYEILRENIRALELAQDASGRAFTLLPIEEAPRTASCGPRYCRSYVNYYCVNGAVIAPAYGVEADRRVESLLKTAYPRREVIMLPIGRIAAGGGGFHCITQQQPAT
jgi:agmatine deiminase